MVNNLFFLLPVDRSIVSNYVRALCLKDYAPNNWNFLYVEGPENLCRDRLRCKFIIYNYYWKVLKKISKNGFASQVYFIKPSSAFVIIISRFVFGIKTYVDINDPIHLNSHLGRLSRVRAWLIFRLSTGIVFESEEYRNFIGKKYFDKSTVVEDTPQFSHVFNNIADRKKQVIWYGSSGTSVVLLEYINYLKLFTSYGYELQLMGASEIVCKKLKEEGISLVNLPKYQHAELVQNATDSMINFVPMPNIQDYSLRGNLKAKFGMACGCITIASDIEMHRRLIVNGKTGYTFSDVKSLQTVLDDIESESGIPMIVANRGNEYVANIFTLENHAKKITEFFARDHRGHFESC